MGGVAGEGWPGAYGRDGYELRLAHEVNDAAVSRYQHQNVWQTGTVRGRAVQLEVMELSEHGYEQLSGGDFGGDDGSALLCFARIAIENENVNSKVLAVVIISMDPSIRSIQPS